MSKVNIRREIQASVDQAVQKLTDVLKEEGFGILTRIDFDQKMKEKLNKELPPVVILGACNPALAYEAYQRNTDVASLIPCNAVVRQLAPGRVSVELARPSALMEMLGEKELAAMAEEADRRLERALARL